MSYARLFCKQEQPRIGELKMSEKTTVISPVTRPLAEGVIIEFCQERATVVFDDGGDTLIVKADGVTQKWYWELESKSCSVVPPVQGH